MITYRIINSLPFNINSNSIHINLVMSAPNNNANLPIILEPPQVSSEESSPLSSAKERSYAAPDAHDIQEYTLYQPSQTELCVQVDNTLAVKEGKLVVPAILIHDDPSKQTKNGLEVMHKVVETIDRLGYDNCLGHKKKTPFLKGLNGILHADDGPLSNFKKGKDASFHKKCATGLKAMDKHLLIPHSDGKGANGEEWPAHLHAILNYYKSVKNTSSLQDVPPNTSALNLVVQRSIFEQQPSEYNTLDVERTSVRSTNVKAGRELVVRGNNSHDASGNEIKNTTPSSIVDRKKPNVYDLMKVSNDSKDVLNDFLSSYKNNSTKREDRLANECKRKLLIKEDKNKKAKKKIEMAEKRQRIQFLIQGIGMAKEEIRMFRDDPDMKQMAVERYKELYSEFDNLMKEEK